MKVTNITNKGIKPNVVSVMINVRGIDKRFDLQPGEFIYSNGDFNSLFNKSLRVQRQKGLIDVIDENDLIQMEKDRIEDEEKIALSILLKKQEEEEKLAASLVSETAFEEQKLFDENVSPHPDIIVIKTKEPDYSSNIIQEDEEKHSDDKKKIIGRPFTKKKKD
jgi:hypothetical protein